MIGNRIKEVRERNGLTQSELAKKLGLTRSGVNAWEMGISIPSAQYLIGLANLFKVSVDYLLGLNEKEYIDISSLNQTEKSIIYSLMSYFRESKTLPSLHNIDEEIMEEIYRQSKKSGTPLPDGIREIFEEKFG